MTTGVNIGSDFKAALLYISVIMLFTGCNNKDTSRELVPVKAGVTSYVGEAASFVAAENGIFEKHGLDVTLQVNRAGSESVRQLLAGEINIAHVAESPILYSILDDTYFNGEQKGNLQIVANMIYANQIQKVLARKDAGIESPKDIRGKRVALAGGTQLEYLLNSFLLEHRIELAEIDTVHMPVSDQVDAIRRGEIDVAVVWEPHATNIEFQIGEEIVILPTRLTYSTLWLTTVLDNYAEENPEVITAYLRALLEAQQIIRDNPGRTVDLLAARTSVEREVIEKAISQIDFELNLTERMLNLLAEQQEWMVESGIANQPETKIFELVNFRFMEEIHPDGITIIQ